MVMQIIFSKLQGNKVPKVNNDTFASKVVHRGLANIVMCVLMHSIWLMYHGQVLMCGGREESSYDYINAFCWALGVHIYGNHTEILEARLNPNKTVTQSMYAGVPGKAEEAESKIFLTKIAMMPAFLLALLFLSMCGRFCWTFLQKNLLTELIGILDTRKTNTTRNIIPKKDDRNYQINESYLTLMQHTRFYDDYAIFYIGCTVVNLIAIIAQYFFVVIHVGEWNHFFALSVTEYFFVNYEKWPIHMVTAFPSIAVCHYTQIQITGKPITKDYLCSMKWNASYLKFFAVLWYIQVFCIALLAISLVYWILFFFVRRIRESAVNRTLKLDIESPALIGMQRLSPGTLFIILLLNKNVKTSVVCRILTKVGKENARSLDKYQRGLQ